MNLCKLAKGQECTVRIPSICNHDPETTVLAHLNGGGIGMKHPDLLGAWACSACHAWIDGGYINHYQYEPFNEGRNARIVRDAYHLEAIIRTQQKLLDMGLQGAIDAWRE